MRRNVKESKGSHITPSAFEPPQQPIVAPHRQSTLASKTSADSAKISVDSARKDSEWDLVQPDDLQAPELTAKAAVSVNSQSASKPSLVSCFQL